MATFSNEAFYFIFIGVYVINVISFNPLLTYTVRYKKIDAKPNITIHHYSIDEYKYVQYISGQISINTNKSINRVVVVFHRCENNGINCEYFQTWTLTDICSKLKEVNQLWSRWYSSFDPPMRCPLDKVHYKIKNATVDVGLGTLLYPQATDYQWKVVQNMYADDILVGSYSMDISIFGYRKRIKSTFKP